MFTTMRADSVSPTNMLPARKAASNNGQCMATQPEPQKTLHTPAGNRRILVKVHPLLRRNKVDNTNGQLTQVGSMGNCGC